MPAWIERAGIFVPAATIERRLTPEISTEIASIRSLGRRAVEVTLQELERERLNHDPLAHVRLLLDTAPDRDAVERRIAVEFRTDMAERARDRHFYNSFSYELDGDDLISEEGLSATSMLEMGMQAARREAAVDPSQEFMVRRAKIQHEHIKMIHTWRNSGEPGSLMVSSLCPPDTEHDSQTLRKAGYRPERMMASNWIFERTNDGIRMHVFSMDQLSNEVLEHHADKLGGITKHTQTTEERLAMPILLPYEDGQAAVEAFRRIHDEYLYEQTGRQHVFGIDQADTKHEANAAVSARPEAFAYYRQAIEISAISLVRGVVTPELAAHAQDLRQVFGQANCPEVLLLEAGQPLPYDTARAYIDYLRSYALPHYIYGQEQSSTHADATIAGAGRDAVGSGVRYDASCPTSAMSETAPLNAQSVWSVNGAKNSEAWQWRKGVCRVQNCFTKPSTTEVGPCSVCRHCQKHYDNHKNPFAENRKQRERLQKGRKRPQSKQSHRSSKWWHIPAA